MPKVKSTVKASTKPLSRPPPPPALPAWPPIVKSKAPLQLTELHPGLIVVDDFWVSTSLWTAFLPTIPLLASPPAKKGEAQRTNERAGFQDPAFAEKLWIETGLRELCQAEVMRGGDGVKKPCGLNPNIRLYKYPEGTYFGPHYDDYYQDPITKHKSEWTLLVYLTGEEDGCKGGGTAFYPDGKLRKPPMVVNLKRGRALLHRHGQECMLHEGQPVLAGEKWVLRSDVMFS